MVRVHEGPPLQDYQAVSRFAKSEKLGRTSALTCLTDVVEAFLLSRTVGGCTGRTIALYRTVLGPLVASLGDEVRVCTALAVQTYLSTLRARVAPTTAHLHFSKHPSSVSPGENGPRQAPPTPKRGQPRESSPHSRLAAHSRDDRKVLEGSPLATP